jgi:23S rRNA (uracil1939-C5)-methyltransferase
MIRRKRHRPAVPDEPAEPVRLEIEKLIYGGDGLAHQGGITYFLPFVLPGESIVARPVDRRKNFVRAEVAEIVRPSPDRVTPPCPYFTVCGGCNYQHIPYERQLQMKSEIVRETLARLGRVIWNGPIEPHASPPFGYRNRAQWKVRRRKPFGGSDRGLAIGYFHARSTSLCAVDQCAVLAPPLAAALTALRTELESGELPETIREIAAFAEPSGGLLMNVSVAAMPDAPRRLAERLRAAVPDVRSLLMQETDGERMELDGPGHLSYPVGGIEYQVGHMSFFQVNRYLIEGMVEAVAAGPAGGLALDLFAGVGLFSVPLARRFARVVAVEADPAAARDLEENLKAAGAGAQAMNADAAQFLANWQEQPDLVVLDPPREGVPAEALSALARLRPKQIIYVSCDPSTLARDLRGLAEAGYEIAQLHVFDVFPQTYHIETLVHLTGKP